VVTFFPASKIEQQFETAVLSETKCRKAAQQRRTPTPKAFARPRIAQNPRHPEAVQINRPTFDPLNPCNPWFQTAQKKPKEKTSQIPERTL
jgi:hypothetical protein